MQLSPAMLTLFIEMEINAWFCRYTKYKSLQPTCYPLCRGKIERSKNLTFLCIHSTSTRSAQAEGLSWIIQDQTCWGCRKFNTSAPGNFSNPIFKQNKKPISRFKSSQFILRAHLKTTNVDQSAREILLQDYSIDDYNQTKTQERSNKHADINKRIWVN